MTDGDSLVGPVLLLDEIRDGRMHLAALFVVPDAIDCPPVTPDGGPGAEAATVARYEAFEVRCARFTLPSDGPSCYAWNGTDYALAGLPEGDLRIAFVSCNGEEVGDLEREGSERNAMWARLRAEHCEAPFALLLHGGDQVYADEATKGHPLSENWPHRVPRAAAPEALEALQRHLREAFARRYAVLYASPEFAWIAARVPSLMQWDDHDICDGWGSLGERETDSAVGQTLFAVARESFLVFQHGAAEDTLPARFADRTGGHLGWEVRAPALRILAPDLRSERRRRAIMGDGGWEMMERAAAQDAPGRTLLLSSVPLLGPRLSVLERLMGLIPKMQEYEDDLRDQWQSRAHRQEWRRILRLVCGMAEAEGQEITAISGEIHLATRAVMELEGGRAIHQLVASGIAHRPPPKAWARVLGLLAWTGEDPLPEHPIRIERLPGQPGRYVAERNYLVLERRGGAWQAVWELEDSGRTPPLALG